MYSNQRNRVKASDIVKKNFPRVSADGRGGGEVDLC